jgi:hypothetical protein
MRDRHRVAPRFSDAGASAPAPPHDPYSRTPALPHSPPHPPLDLVGQLGAGAGAVQPDASGGSWLRNQVSCRASRRGWPADLVQRRRPARAPRAARGAPPGSRAPAAPANWLVVAGATRARTSSRSPPRPFIVDARVDGASSSFARPLEHEDERAERRRLRRRMAVPPGGAAGEQRQFQRPQEPLPAAPIAQPLRRRRVERGEPAVQLRVVQGAQPPLQRRAPLRIELGLAEDRVGQRAQKEPGPADEDRHRPRSRIRDRTRARGGRTALR